uniref:NADH-ubiquinone oxidoreductase chain 6 n=1 Tax=Lista haraldusalis TaxID=1429835 RepID=A0A067YFM1_9NEOP|nr:NADH dehydrogenase subunit 6 [Lista haraldusalis]AHB23436.1 NADH dehydrogenase subunit 6 [Lista haraldusalis]
MMKMFFSMNLIFFSLIMFFLNHPLSMGLKILIQTILICSIKGMLIGTYWFSYILFLTFLGGLLVLFIYVSSIASNEMFKFSIKSKYNMIMIIYIIIIIMFMLKYNMTNFDKNMEMKSLFNFTLFMNYENNINISKLYNNQTFKLMMMMIIYLLITLIAVVKITNIFLWSFTNFKLII